MTQAASSEVLPDGSVRMKSGESALAFARPTSSVLVVTIFGYDKGQFGTAPFDEIGSVLRVAAPVHLFVDARNAVGATIRVSEDWTSFLSLHRTAFAYARLMASSEGDVPGALDRYETSAGHVVEAMTAFPYFVAGAWSMTTPLMEAYGGALVAKEGAEGLYAMAVAPNFASTLTSRLRLADDCALGIALKVDDGSMTRGRNPVILKTLEILGFDVAAKPELQRYREWPLRNVAGTLVGEVRAEFELEFV